MDNSKRKPRHYKNFHTFIYRLLKHSNPQANMTSEAKDLVNELVKQVAFRYVTSAVLLCHYAKKITIDLNAIKTLTRVWLSEHSDNADNIIDFAHDTWDVYTQNTTKGVKKYQKAGLSLPPARIQEMFKEYRGVDQKIGEHSYIFLTAILESVFDTLLQKAFSIAKQDRLITINGLHIYNALNSSIMSGYRPLFPRTFVVGFGYIQNQVLLQAQDDYVRRHECDNDSDESI